MNLRKYIFLGLIGAFILGSSNGWAFLGRYGKLVPRWLSLDKTSIYEVYENWENYHVYYAGLSVENPSAIMFDPKKEDKKLTTHDNWVQVKNQEELSELIRWIRATHAEFYPILWRVLSPTNELYGYMYTSAWTHAVIKVVDEKTMWVDDIPLPPIDYGGTESGRRV